MNLERMGSTGSPFDAPLPRFQQAAAHLSSSLGASTKKPPLCPSLPESKSLKQCDDRHERQTLADFAPSMSLERSTSFTRRRYSRQDLNFSQANSLTSVLENSTEADLASLPSSNTPEPLQAKSASISPATYLHSPPRSFFSQRLPGLLAATGMLLLLVMSLVALWPPTNGGPTVPRVQANPGQPSLSQRIFDKLFRGGSSGGPLHMEHFTAAQAAGNSNVGFGLEDPNTAVKQAHPSHDFERFVSTHLGFEPEEDVGTQRGQSRADFVAAYQSAEATSDNQAAKGEAQMTTGKPGLEGRKELEADPSTSTSAPVNSGGQSTGWNGGINGDGQSGTEQTGLSSASLNAQTNDRVGVIPQESILPSGTNPLAGSSGIPDPKNLKGASTNTGSSSGVSSGSGTNTAGQLSSSGSASTNNAAGTFGSVTSSGAADVKSSDSMAGKIAVQPGTNGGVNTAAGSNTGSTASSLRHGSSAGQNRASGATASETVPLDTMSRGQVTSVAASELSSTQQTGSQRSGLVTTMGGSFVPLTGRKMLSSRR